MIKVDPSCIQDFCNIAQNFGLNTIAKNTEDGVVVEVQGTHGIGHVEFLNDGEITAIIDDDENPRVFAILPNQKDYRSASIKFQSALS